MTRNTKFSKNVVYAHGVHIGGGLSLLDDIVQYVGQNDDYILIMDNRTRQFFEQYNLKNVKYFNAGILGRIQSEIYLKRKEKDVSTVLSFNSLSFILTFKFRAVVFFQNMNLISAGSFDPFTSSFKRLLFRLTSKNVDKFLVQSKTVADALKDKCGNKVEILTLLDNELFSAFKKHIPRDVYTEASSVKKTFIYPAGNLPHKNHAVLLEGWTLFRNTFPEARVELIITISKDELHRGQETFDNSKLSSLGVRNVGFIDRKVIYDLYKQSDVLLYPSLSESFGIPLMEAETMGLDIIASDAEYVFEVASPSEVFNPNSSVSIAKAIARYFCLKWPKSINPVNATSFVEHIFGENK